MRPKLPQHLRGERCTITAVTQAIFFAGGLWWFTYFHYLIRVLYGFPGLADPAFALGFYEDLPGHAFNLPEFFMGLSIGATALAIVGVWMTSRETRGKWRQRFLVLFFGAVCCWFASLSFAWETQFLHQAKRQLEYRKANPMMYYPPGTPSEISSREWIHLEIAIKKAEERRNRE